MIKIVLYRISRYHCFSNFLCNSKRINSGNPQCIGSLADNMSLTTLHALDRAVTNIFPSCQSYPSNTSINFITETYDLIVTDYNPFCIKCVTKSIVLSSQNFGLALNCLHTDKYTFVVESLFCMFSNHSTILCIACIDILDVSESVPSFFSLLLFCTFWCLSPPANRIITKRHYHFYILAIYL